MNKTIKLMVLPILAMFLINIALAQDINFSDEKIKDMINNSEEYNVNKLIEKNKNTEDFKKIDKNITDKIKEGKKTRVWVKYKNELSPETFILSSVSKTKANNKEFKQETVQEINSKEQLQSLENNAQVSEVIEDPILNQEVTVAVPYIGGDVVQSYYVDNGINHITINGVGQTVCVVDGGITYTNKDLGGCFGPNCKVITGYDYAANDNDPTDPNGHGTHVAGIIAADGTIKGVAPKAKLIAQRVCNDAGSCYGSSMYSAVEWCADNAELYNISVITMSIGDGGAYNSTNPCPTWMDAAMKKGYDKGIMITVASGNQAKTTGVSYPACSPYATAVGATGRNNDILQSFTNRGPGLDLLAPGASIYSTCGTSYCTKSGTSMATPFVAGTAALIKQYYKAGNNQNISPAEIEQLLKETGKTVGTYKRIDILKAVQKAGWYKISEKWVQTPTSCIDGQRLISYYDKNNVGTTEDMPSSNGMYIPCTVTNDPNTGLEMEFNENTGEFTFDSAYDMIGTIKGATWTIGYEGSALNFNGTTFVSVKDAPSLNITGQLVSEAWINTNTITGTQTILSKRNGNYMYTLALSTNKLYGCVGDGTKSDCTAKATAITANTWQNVKMTYDDTKDTIKIYLNGQMKEAKYTNISLKPFTANTTIGADTQGTTNFFKGKIDEAKISKTVTDPDMYDLEMTSIQITNTNKTLSTLNPVNFSLSFTNKLDKTTNIKYNILIDGVVTETRTIDAINANTKITQTFNSTFTKGTHIIKISTDTDNQYNEINETNNDKQLSFTVYAPITCYQCNTATWSIVSQVYIGTCAANWYTTPPTCKAPQIPTECIDGQRQIIFVNGNNLGTIPCTINTDPNTVLEMDFNENIGDLTFDNSQNNNPGAIKGATWTDGKEGTALNYNGTNSIIVKDAPSLNITGQLTLEAWINTNTTTGTQTILSKRNGNNMYTLALSTNKLYGCVGDGTKSDCTAKLTPITANTWQNVKMTYDDTKDTIKIYLNGQMKEAKYTNISLKPFTANTTIGADTQGTTNFFKGKIDNVKISKTITDPDMYDLEMTSIQITNTNKLNINEPVNFNFNFLNKADKITNVQYNILIDGIAIQTKTIDSINTNTKTTQTFSNIFTKGRHTLKIVTDSDSQYNEINETNNEKQVTFDVYAPITCYQCNTTTWTITNQTYIGTCATNWYTTPPTCKAPQPTYDLEMTSIQITNMNELNINEPVSFNFNFANKADNVNNVKYDIIIDGAVYQTRTMPEFSSNTQTTHIFEQMFTQGRHTLKIVVDSDNQFSETDELNNEKQVTFDVY